MKTIPLDTTTEAGREIVKALMELIHNFTTYGSPVATSRSHRIWSESIARAKIIQRALSDAPEKSFNTPESSRSVTNGGLSGGMSNNLTDREFPPDGLNVKSGNEVDFVTKCSCYDGFDCPKCNPEKYQESSITPIENYLESEEAKQREKEECICGFDAEGWRYMTIGEEILEVDEVKQNQTSVFKFKPVRFFGGVIVRTTGIFRTRRPLPGCPACNVPASDISPNRVDKTVKCEHDDGDHAKEMAKCEHKVTDCDRKPFSLEEITQLMRMNHRGELMPSDIFILSALRKLETEINRLRESRG